MTEEEYANWVMSQANLAANEYGRPFVNDGTNDFKELGYNTDALKDIGSIAGINWSEFSGVPDAPVMPEGQPFQSDYIQAVGGPDSLPGLIAQGMEQGFSPQVAFNKIVDQAPEESKNAWLTMSPDAKQAVYGQAIKYREEAIKEARENADYNAQVAEYEDWYREPTLWENAGYTDKNSFVDRQRGGGLSDLVTRVGPGQRRRGDANGIFDSVPRGGSFDVGNVVRGAANNTVAAAQPMTTGYLASGANASKAIEASGLDAMAKAAQSSMQQKMPSKDEEAKKARLSAAYNLIFGAPAPR